ncbi:hypothetical protein VN0871_08400 [Helicobacter pylori]
MEKIETTIFVDWENLLTDLRAIQKNPKTDKRFKELDFSFNNPEQLLALIRNKELEKYKDKNPKNYEKRVNKSGIIQAFNHEIAQQNQVKLRVGRVMFEFEFEDKEVYNGLEAKIPIPHLKLRQKQIDALLAHDITKLYCTKQGGCILLFSKDTDFVPVLEAAWEKDFEVFIANIQEGPNLVPPDLRKSCDVRERSVAEILAKLPKVATTSNTPKKENSNEPFNNPFKDHLYKKN